MLEIKILHYLKLNFNLIFVTGNNEINHFVYSPKNFRVLITLNFKVTQHANFKFVERQQHRYRRRCVHIGARSLWRAKDREDERDTLRSCARHGAAWKEVRDTDVTLDLEARRVPAQTYLAAISHPLRTLSAYPFFLSPGASTLLFGGARLRLQILRKIISIYAKQRERLCSDNIDSIQPVPLASHPST